MTQQKIHEVYQKIATILEDLGYTTKNANASDQLQTNIEAILTNACEPEKECCCQQPPAV